MTEVGALRITGGSAQGRPVGVLRAAFSSPVILRRRSRRRISSPAAAGRRKKILRSAQDDRGKALRMTGGKALRMAG